MPDREKVIKGLTACVDDMCDYCPYYDEEVPDCDYFGRCNRKDMYDDALAIIREQEPVKPIRTPETIRAEYNCGNCTGKVGIKFYDGFWYFKAQYCPACGRKVAWDEQAD